MKTLLFLLFASFESFSCHQDIISRYLHAMFICLKAIYIDFWKLLRSAWRVLRRNSATDTKLCFIIIFLFRPYRSLNTETSYNSYLLIRRTLTHFSRQYCFFFSSLTLQTLRYKRDFCIELPCLLLSDDFNCGIET